MSVGQTVALAMLADGLLGDRPVLRHRSMAGRRLQGGRGRQLLTLHHWSMPPQGNAKSKAGNGKSKTGRASFRRFRWRSMERAFAIPMRVIPKPKPKTLKVQTDSQLVMLVHRARWGKAAICSRAISVLYCGPDMSS